jgi:hypothetical protein
MDRYPIPTHPGLISAKNKLDIFSELLFNYHFLSKAIFTTTLDREACYNAFKGFVDIVRYNDAACSENLHLKTRHETITYASCGEDSPLKALLVELSRWRDRNFSLSDASGGCIRSAYSMALDILNVLSKSINSEVSKLDGTQRFYEVKNLKEAGKENVLHPVFIEPKWTIVAEDILKRSSSNVKGVWLAYFYFIIITNNAIGRRLHEITDVAAAVFRRHRLTIPDHYSFPLVVTEDMLRALLFSCYTVNPFLYYDFMSEDRYLVGTNIMDSLREPSHSLLFLMAKEALSIHPILIRQNFANKPNSMRLYRNALKLLRLKILLFLRKIIVPHEKVFDYYREVFPEEAGWIIELKQDSEQIRDAGRREREDIFIRYYPKIRSLIDSMGWVFNPPT